MKNIILGAALLLSSFAFKANAQLKINLNLNIGNQPEWGPTGYDHADYYYFPDIDCYYNVSAHQYVYFNNNAWITAASLPPRYGNFDVYNSYKVVVNQPQPWRNAASIRAKYARFKGQHSQQVIRDSRDNKYQNHWHGDDNNHGNDHAHGRPDNHGGNDHGGHGDDKGDHGHH